MQVSDSKRGDIFPRDVTVRPVRGYAEQQRWDALAARHHYLSFKTFMIFCVYLPRSMKLACD